MAVYGYIRVSTTQQVEGSSLADQRRRIEAIAQFHGWVLDDVFEDRGVSGSVALHERPAGHKLVGHLKAGDTLIVGKLDRLFRSAEDAVHRANRWSDEQVDLILGDVSTDPVTRDGVGRLFFTMLAAMAEFERNRIRERSDAGRAAKIAKGGFIGGKAPFGYIVVGSGKSATLSPHPTHFAARAKIVSMYRRGSTLREIRAHVEKHFAVKLGIETIRRLCLSALPAAGKANLMPPLPDVPQATADFKGLEAAKELLG